MSDVRSDNRTGSDKPSNTAMGLRRGAPPAADLAAVEAGLAALPCRLSELAEVDYERMHPTHRTADALRRTRRQLAATQRDLTESRCEALDLAIELHHHQGGRCAR